MPPFSRSDAARGAARAHERGVRGSAGRVRKPRLRVEHDPLRRRDGDRQFLEPADPELWNLFGWMAVAHFVLFQPPLKVDTPAHWFSMQIGTIIGYLTAWPANRWLVRSGRKEAMGSDRREPRSRRTRAATDALLSRPS